MATQNQGSHRTGTAILTCLRGRRSRNDVRDLSSTKILLATDGSEGAELATRAAIDLADSIGFELHVVYVEPLAGFMKNSAGEPGYDHGLYEKIEEEAQQKLRKLTWQVKVAGGAVDGSHLRIGGVAEEVAELADELGAGLLVVGSRDRGRIRRALTGSVSDWIVRHALCPVLVVRPQKTTDERAHLSHGSVTAGK
jgi:nucleotide-binding universal stress UspA family protein